MTVAVWLGASPPVRSVRWLDGALATATKLGGKPTAVAAGATSWIELVADRALRARCACVAVTTDLKLDYIGWGQIAGAVLRKLDAKTVLVDEASRPERAAEVAAIADALDITQLTRVSKLTAEGDVLHATRTVGSQSQAIRIVGPAVIGVRIPGPAVDEHATPVPAAGLKRFTLAELGLDALVLGHRALAPRAAAQPKKSVERITEHVAVHLVARGT